MAIPFPKWHLGSTLKPSCFIIFSSLILTSNTRNILQSTSHFIVMDTINSSTQNQDNSLLRLSKCQLQMQFQQHQLFKPRQDCKNSEWRNHRAITTIQTLNCNPKKKKKKCLSRPINHHTTLHIKLSKSQKKKTKILMWWRNPNPSKKISKAPKPCCPVICSLHPRQQWSLLTHLQKQSLKLGKIQGSIQPTMNHW